LQSQADKIYDVVIIGGGPAGFTAGLYAARASLQALVIEGATTLSQITMTDLVENYPGMPEGIDGFTLVQRFRNQAEKFGLEIKQADVTALVKEERGGKEIWKVAAGDTDYAALSVIVATGANWRRIGVPGEDRFAGKGVSYCATCDGPFYRNKEVVVIGAGDTAIQEALFLSHLVRKVTIVHRRNRLRATKCLQDRALADRKIHFILESVVEEITGEDFVQGVKIKNLQTGEVQDLATDGVFVFIGIHPNTEILRNLVELDKDGYILADVNMQTSAKGIYAAGDCTRKLLRQVITACGDGATAAYAAQLYVEELKGEAYCPVS